MRFAPLVALFILTSVVSGYGEPLGADKDKTVITSDRMITESGKNRIKFEGNVEAVNGKLVLKSDELEVFSDDKQQTLRKIVATGNVKVTKGERKIQGGSAELLYAEKQVVITGNPVVFEKGNRLTGEKIIYSYEKETIIIEKGAAKRASVVLSMPKKSEK